LLQAACLAQVNSGSDGSDGPFNPTTSTTINMATHPNGIYQYTSVNVPSGVTVTFAPNVNDTPVVWLVQGDVVINGTVDLSGGGPGYPYSGASFTAGVGGPGGRGGGNNGDNATSGQGSGGGGVGPGSGGLGGNASYGTAGDNPSGCGSPGSIYGNNFLIPLLGGSGGGGSPDYAGAGGGGAILIASSTTIQLSGAITAYGGSGFNGLSWTDGGAGSGGAVRLVAATITGGGKIDTGGAMGPSYSRVGGNGRVRFDCYLNNFGGEVNNAMFTQGSQFVVVPRAGSGAQLTITSAAGVPVSASPGGLLTTPDVAIPAQQPNPIPIVVQCSNIPLHTQITVSVTPVTGPVVSATGYNDAGTVASSTATVSITMPHGGGLISASAATGN